jgi:N-acyl-phosphatidylethanolamine-hydrolysing phospholipase D
MQSQPTPVSKHLSLRQLRALEKIGDILVPGDKDLPSFSRSGCVSHVDRILDFMPAGNLREMKRVLSVVSFMPRLLVRVLLRWLHAGLWPPGPWAAPLRILRLGLRGLVMSLYYSGRVGPNFEGPAPLDVLSYRVGVADAGGNRGIEDSAPATLENPTSASARWLSNSRREFLAQMGAAVLTHGFWAHGYTVGMPMRSSAAGPHHHPGGGFRNPWPDVQIRGFIDSLRWLGERRSKPPDPNPPRDSLRTETSVIVHPRAPRGHHSATWIGHSTVLLQLGPLNVLTDPVWSERASPFQWVGPRRLMAPGVEFDDLPEIDLVLLSHDHYDHLDAHTARRIAERFPNATWLCPLRLGPLLRWFGVQNLVERDWWQSANTATYSATCTPAQHFSGRGLGDRGDRLWGGWTLATDDVRVYFAGDTGLHPEFDQIGQRLGPFDLVMLPIGAYEPRWFMRSVHLNPEDTIEAYRAIVTASATRPPCLALHWGTFRLTDEPVEEPPARFTDRWREAGFPDSANWTFAHGETRRF